MGNGQREPRVRVAGVLIDIDDVRELALRVQASGGTALATKLTLAVSLEASRVELGPSERRLVRDALDGRCPHGLVPLRRTLSDDTMPGPRRRPRPRGVHWGVLVAFAAAAWIVVDELVLV